MLSGLFDRHPGVQVILGHLAEGLPSLLPRLAHRLDKQKHGMGLDSARRKVSEYFSDNFQHQWRSCWTPQANIGISFAAASRPSTDQPAAIAEPLRPGPP